jgi:hypothetical protein
MHWELKTGLIGFTQLNNAHNGKRLGQALFLIVRRVGIEHKVSTASFAKYVPPDRLCHFRLVTSHATTQVTMARC